MNEFKKFKNRNKKPVTKLFFWSTLKVLLAWEKKKKKIYLGTTYDITEDNLGRLTYKDYLCMIAVELLSAKTACNGYKPDVV